jgi:hypothetical protein
MKISTNRIGLDEDGKEFFEYEYNEDFDMYTFIYETSETDTDDPVGIKTELGSVEAKAIMEAMINHVLSHENLSKEDFVNRYLVSNKFRGNYEQ